MSGNPAASTLATLRRLLLGLLIVGMLGTGAELLLIGHFEDEWQLVPLVVLAVALVMSGLVLARPRPPGAVLKLFRASMLLLVASGGIGNVLHYRANMEFKLEIDPTLGGLPLFWSVMEAKAPPALAPGTLALFGLLGLAAAWRLGDAPPDGWLQQERRA